MKFKNLFLVVMVFFLVLPILADEEEKMPYLEKAYLGGLYMRLVTEEYYDSQNGFLPLIAAKTKFPLFSGHLRSRLMYDFEGLGAHLWWEKRISFLEFKYEMADNIGSL